MCTVNLTTIGHCKAELFDHGFAPTKIDRHGNTIWTNTIGDTAEIKLNFTTGNFEIWTRLPVCP